MVATSQPKNVHPRKIVIKVMGKIWLCFLAAAIKIGKKYSAKAIKPPIARPKNINIIIMLKNVSNPIFTPIHFLVH